MKLIPHDAREKLHCYCCNIAPAKYIMEGTVHCAEGDITLRVPLCNVCALTEVVVESAETGVRWKLQELRLE